MMRFHVPAARRSGLALLLAGFAAGILLTMTALSAMRDSGHELRQLPIDDPHRHHHHRHQVLLQNGAIEELKVVDLAEQDKHKHAGLNTRCALEPLPSLYLLWGVA